MKQTKKIISTKICLAVLAVALLAAGCGSGTGGQSNAPVTLTIWKPFASSDDLQPLISAYQQQHPNVHIVYTKKDYTNYESDLLNGLAAGSGPDIFSINNSWLPKYLDKLAPAPDKVFLYKDYKDAFVDTVVRDFTQDNKIYGTALSVDSLALYYNKDILGSAGIATPPKTWNELASDVQKIKRSDGRGYFSLSGAAWGTNSNVSRAVDILYLFMLQQGAQPYSSDGSQPTFANNIQINGSMVNPGVAALNYYTSFANPTSVNYNWNLRSDYSIDAFANGRAAFLLSYYYSRATILSKAPNLNFDIASAPQPNLSDPAVNFSNYWGEVVSKQSKNSAVAWDFLKFLTTKDSLDKYYAQSKQPSSRRDLISLQIQDPVLGVFANANLTSKPFYRPDQAKLDDIFGKVIDNVILNGMSTTDALNQAQQQAAAISRTLQ